MCVCGEVKLGFSDEFREGRYELKPACVFLCVSVCFLCVCVFLCVCLSVCVGVCVNDRE